MKPIDRKKEIARYTQRDEASCPPLGHQSALKNILAAKAAETERTTAEKTSGVWLMELYRLILQPRADRINTAYQVVEPPS